MGTQRTRREFLGNVGRGMLVASVGAATALDMGLAPAWADDGGGERLAFGGLEPLVGLMQETSVRDLVPVLVEKLRAGTELKQLVAAAALANARTFGGEDYVGFHTLMALAPAYHMARELPEDEGMHLEMSRLLRFHLPLTATTMLTLATLPIVTVYIFGQRFFVRGLVAGALKGE